MGQDPVDVDGGAGNAGKAENPGNDSDDESGKEYLRFGCSGAAQFTPPVIDYGPAAAPKMGSAPYRGPASP